MKKYEFTDEIKTIEREEGEIITLHQIKAARDIGKYVKKGDIGGWIECEENLSHEGTAWVHDNAKVYDSAKVYEYAQIYENAEIFDDTWVYGTAQIFDNAKVHGGAHICGKAEVFGNAEICDAVIIGGKMNYYKHFTQCT